MFEKIKQLNQEDAISVIYHLIMILNKGKNNSDEEIEFNVEASDLNEKTEIVFDEFLIDIDFIHINEDDVLNNYINKLYQLLQKKLSENIDINLNRGKEKLSKLDFKL